MGDSVMDQLREKVSRRRATAKILLDQALVAEHAQLEAELSAAVTRDVGLNEPDQSPEVARRIEALEARLDTECERFVFESVGTTAWFKLVTEHPPLDSQRRTHDTNWVTFRPAAIAASSVEPKLTVDDAQWLMDELPVSEWEKLWAACMEANVGADARPKSALASTLRQLSAPSSATPLVTGSLAEPSSAAPEGPSPSTSTTTPDG